MGRPRKPEAEKVLRGNPGKRKLADPETTIAPIGTVPKVQPPWWLTHELPLKVWDVLAPELASAHLLTDAMATTFARYCVLMARWIKDHEFLLENDAVYETDSAHGKMKRIEPIAALDAKLAKELLSLEAQFGLTPLSRQGMQAKLAAGGLPLTGGAAAKPTNDQSAKAEAAEQSGSSGGQLIGFLN